MNWNRCHLGLVIVMSGLLGAGCGGSGKEPSASSSGVSTPVARTTAVSLNKDDYPVFPDADTGADPSVSAELGGKGFTGKDWETNTTFGLTGDPRAVKGGRYREAISDFPGTLRMGGPEWNTYVNYLIGEMVYEHLLSLDPTTLDYVPQLASHWQLSADKMTFRFRLNPNARWSNGEPVTADDVIASWGLFTDKGLNDPAQEAEFSKLEKPVAESKYIIRVKAKTLDWKHFLNFATSLTIFPASVLKTMDGKAYLSDYNYKYLPNTGPYIVNASDIEKGKSITLHRRKDYWAEKSRLATGLNNFDEVKLTIVRDPNLIFEMFKKGDLDFYYVNRSKVWATQLDFDKIQNGQIQKRKVFNETPEGFNGFAFNTRRKPFDDVRVRKALALLLNRDELIEKIFYKEYLPMNSYFSGTFYQNPGNAANVYNPTEALKLLADAGWNSRDAKGRLVKDGKPLTVEILYDNQLSQTYLTVYQEALRKVGITLDLRLVTFETQFKLTSERQFDVAEVGWGASIFPDPEQEWHSRLADVNNTDNLTGFKDPKMDAIIEKYGKSFDQKERVALIQELDGIMTSQYHYILKWSGPSQRIIYWNRFGYPQGYLTRIGEYMSGLSLGVGPEQLWWIDPARSAALDKAIANPSIKLEVGQTEDHYWQEFEAGKKK